MSAPQIPHRNLEPARFTTQQAKCGFLAQVLRQEQKLKASTRVVRLRHFSWKKCNANNFVCIGKAEISRAKRGEPWMAMVPLAYADALGSSFGLLQTDGGPKKFKRAKEAMVAAEVYLNIFVQFRQVNEEESVEPSAGNLRPSASHG